MEPTTTTAAMRARAKAEKIAKDVARLHKRANGRLGKMLITKKRELAARMVDHQTADILSFRLANGHVHAHQGEPKAARERAIRTAGDFMFHYGPKAGEFDVFGPILICDVCREHNVQRVAAYPKLRAGLNWCRDCVRAVWLAEASAPGFAAIVAKAGELGLPLAYHRDLWVHDRNALTDFAPGQDFLWAVGTTGTSIIFPHKTGVGAETFGYGTSASYVHTLRTCSRETIFVFQNGALRLVDDEAAVEFLCSAPPKAVAA